MRGLIHHYAQTSQPFEVGVEVEGLGIVRDFVSVPEHLTTRILFERDGCRYVVTTRGVPFSVIEGGDEWDDERDRLEVELL